MPAHTHPEIGLRVAFHRDGAEIDHETAPAGENARDAALVIISRFDELQDGDKLTVTTARPTRIHPNDLPAAPAMMITAETETHVVVAVEIAKAMLTGYRRLLEQLIEAAENGRRSR